jgi:hypothetical protein
MVPARPWGRRHETGRGSGGVEEESLMRAHPPTPSLAAGRRSCGSLSERFRTWRRQPRKQSPRLFWGLLGLAALLDTFVSGLAVCLLFLTVPGTSWQDWLEGDGGARLPWAACLVAAGMLGVALATSRHRPREARCLGVAGLLGYAAAAACAATLSFWPGAGDDAAWTVASLLAGGLGLLMAWTSRTRTAAFAGILVSALLLIVADCCPATTSPPVPGWDSVSSGGAWDETRGLLVLSGCAALALAWGLGNLTLLVILRAPLGGKSIRELSGSAFRVLRLGVFLLAAGAAMGPMPGWLRREAGEAVVALAGLLLLHARFAGWVQDLGLALGCVGGFAFLLLAWCGATWLPGGPAAWRCFAWLACAVLANASLALHATRRYWFSSPRGA